MKGKSTCRVAVFSSQRGSSSLHVAFALSWYQPRPGGSCEHIVSTDTESDATRLAIAEHKECCEAGITRPRKMLRNNFELALRRAIEREREIETTEERPGFKSAFLAGLEEIQAAVNRGEEIEIVEAV